MNRIASFFGNQTMPQAPSGRKRPLASRPRIVGLAMLCSLAGSGTLAAFDQPQIYQLKPQDQVLILGDSTTADGVRTPGTYVRLLDQAQHEQIPDLGVVIRGLGWGGTCMHDIPGQNRWIGSFLGAAYTHYATKNMKDGKFLPGTGLYDSVDPVIGLHLGVLGETLSARTILQGLGLKPEWKMNQIRLTVKGKGQIKSDPAPTGDKGREGYSPGTKVTLTFTPESSSAAGSTSRARSRRRPTN